MNKTDTGLLDTIVKQVGTILIGKEPQIKLALACLLARGHLLIEDLPGMGKTTLASALARVLGLSYNRLQFTSDLLPADILGFSVYDKNTGSFEFHPGPVFNQLLLADEINRTTPKTQSALLEAMAEGQVTVEGETRPLPTPFFVLATQNPAYQSGTFPLPESQLDRFLMRISLGYPDAESERFILKGGDPRKHLNAIEPVLTIEQLLDLQRQVEEVRVSDAIIDYLQRLLHFTRTRDLFTTGLSPRAALAIVDAAKAFSLMEGRHFVIPEDIQAVFGAVVSHRLEGADTHSQGVDVLVDKVLSAVDII